MAKRQADGQRTKDESSDEEEVDPGNRDKPLAPITGRPVRGLPKRAGGAGANPPPADTMAPGLFGGRSAAAPSFSFGAASSTAPSFGSTPLFGAPASTSSTPLFGAPAPAPSSSNFGGSGSFGVSAASGTPLSTAPKPFAGFSFSGGPSTPAPTPASTATPARSTSKGPASPPKRSGLSPQKESMPDFFGVKDTPLASNQAKPFNFGSTTTPVAPPATPAALPKPFAGFTFPTSKASTSVTTPASPPKAVQPAVPAVPAVPATLASPPKAVQPAAPAVPAANGTSSSTNGPKPSLATPPPENEVEYYLSLRGLNRSFLSFLQSTFDSDNLVDLSTVVPGLLSQYSKYVKEAEDKSGFAPAKPSTSGLANGAGPKPPSNGAAAAAVPTQPPSKPVAAPPAPPKVGGFTLLPSGTSSPAPSGPGFVPSFASTSATTTSPFTFGAAAKPPSKPSAEVSKLVEDVISGKEEAPKSPPKRKAEEEPDTTIAAKKPASMFSFAPSGPLHPSTPDSKSFAPSSSLESPSTMTPPAKLGKFGPGGMAPQLAFGGAKAGPGTPASTSGKPSSFSFGSGSGSGDALSFNVGQEHGPPGTAAQPQAFPFGSVSASAAKPSTGTSIFGFGATSKPTGETSKPATAGEPSKPAPAAPFSFGSSVAPSSSGFSFGQKAGGSAPSFSSSAAAAPFSFTPNFSSLVSTSASSLSLGSEPAEGEGGDSPAPPSPKKNLAEVAGAGEENEDTVLEQRGKLYRLENGKYEVVALGVFKVKRSKEGGKRRLLHRRDGTGHVVLNMAMSATFDPSADGSQIKFLGFDLEGKPAPYSLRVKTADVAKDIVQKMKDEVEAIKKA